jgi:hypothetical protein
MANNFPTIRPTLSHNYAGTGVLPPDVTFTRASSSGGYYDGKTVAKAEENLLIRSGDLTQTVHFKDGVTAASATQIQATATAGPHLTHYNTAIGGLLAGSGTVTQTIRMSAGTYNLIQIFVANDPALGIANIDLTDGTIGTNTLAVTVTDMGSGVYDIKCTYTTSGTNRVLGVALVTSTSAARQQSWTALGTETVNILFQQYEQRSFATAYTPTTTQPITNYIPKMLFAPANVPVFDHNPTTGEALGLSVWEARTNLLLRSQEFDNAYWTKTNASISANQIIAPDGTLTGDKLVENTANSTHFVERSISLSTAAHSFSVFAKKGERNFIWLRGVAAGALNVQAWFNLDTGAVGTISAAGSGATRSIKNMGNGWYLCTLVIPSAVASAFEYRYGVTSADNTTTYTGDGVSGIYIWGAQLETGAFATPYIPTVASTVARSADVAVMTGVNFSRWYRADEGAFVVDAFARATPSSSRFALVVSDGTANNRIGMATRAATTTTGLQVVVGGSTVATCAVTVSADAFYKFAGSYAANDFNAAVNGTLATQDTLGGVPVVTSMTIGSNQAGDATTTLNGYIKSLSYYPTRLTNAQLQAVTA